MIKIKVLTIGKTKESWLDSALDEFYKRLQGQVSFEWILVKDSVQLEQAALKEPMLLCLDSTGKMLDSLEFSHFLQDKILKGGSRLTFVIGGADGLPASLKNHPDKISFSRLTFTHQLVRLLLVEQIYRALEIVRGSPYHK